MKNYLLILVFLFALMSCKKKSINCGLECGTQTEQMVFQTGFDGTVLNNGAYSNVEISGIDTNLTTNSYWDDFQNHPNIGYVEIGYEDGDDSQRKASIVDDPDNPGNEVLKFQLMQAHIKEGSNYKGRVQLSVHNNNCIKELYQTVKLKLHPDMAYIKDMPEKFYWFTLFEFWNNGAWTKEKFPFRISVNLFKEEGAGNEINFRAKADYRNCKTCGWKEVWGETATSFPLVFGEWMEIEIYLKEGDENNGRFYLAVTAAGGSKMVLFDVNNTTQHPKENCADGFTHFEAMKVYTSEDNINYMNDAGKELSLFWDDWSLYINKQP
ncbi:hypothetical protein K6119_02225 [Paracrocinitomix mangrovi]|uniref:hypothetical protein n=1 Tax=Paracrocinitomix mangrovi TaxID=2862509 RepID=UPI001EDC1016|nr:hypothetical protein [Paracrocinitomix mangrovi]UKN02336.1 hypothetical protein K6119_02225 [Paracrocinitomix mangrovi]